MFETLAQTTIYLILTLIAGAIVGYLMKKSSMTKSPCNKGVKGTHELHIDQKSIRAKEEKKEVNLQPKLLNQARDGEKDNLQLIKGVGPVLEELLNKTGIYHLDQIANLTKEEVSWLDSLISFPGRIEREKWVEQAQSLIKNG